MCKPCATMLCFFSLDVWLIFLFPLKAAALPILSVDDNRYSKHVWIKWFTWKRSR